MRNFLLNRIDSGVRITHINHIYTPVTFLRLPLRISFPLMSTPPIAKLKEEDWISGPILYELFSTLGSFDERLLRSDGELRVLLRDPDLLGNSDHICTLREASSGFQAVRIRKSVLKSAYGGLRAALNCRCM